MPKTLLDISEDLLALNALIEEAAGEDGEIGDEVAKVLDEWFADLMNDRDRKLDGYGALIRERELRAAARKEEMERLALRVRVDENAVKYLKQRLLDFLDAHKIKKIETRRYRFSCCANGGLQPLEMPDDPELLPKMYQMQVIKADVETIRESLVDGNVIEGCRLLPRGRHLRIG